MNNRNLIVFLIMFAISIIASFLFELPNEVLNFCLGLTLLFIQLLNFSHFKKQLILDKLIFIKSNEWMGTLPMIGFMIYWFSDEPMNFWNITAILSILAYGILEAIQNFNVIYKYGDEGIRNLRTNKFKAAENIKEVNFNTEKLVIHTDKYRNDLVILAKNLKMPTWETLTFELSKLNKNER